MTRWFWILAGAEFLFFVVVIVLIFTRTLPTGPEGPVGATVLLLPLIVLSIMAAAVYFSKSERVALACLILLAVQLVPFVGAPVYTAYRKYTTTRSLQGDDTFRGPQRLLAHAIKAGDLAKVRELLPAAGNLNTLYDDESLLRFAVMNVGPGGSTIPIVEALLGAGADPNLKAAGTWPLEMAIYGGPELVAVMLKAGASVNALDSGGRPIWWNAFQGRRLAILEMFLGHGADLKLRDSESGVVAEAARAGDWPAVWLLLERGAKWKGEGRYGASVERMVDYAVQQQQQTADGPVLARIKAKLAGGE